MYRAYLMRRPAHGRKTVPAPRDVIRDLGLLASLEDAKEYEKIVLVQHGWQHARAPEPAPIPWDEPGVYYLDERCEVPPDPYYVHIVEV